MEYNNGLSKNHPILGIPRYGGGNKMGSTYKTGDKANTLQCAEFSNGVLRDNGYMISGNAWNHNDVDLVFSGYDGLTKPAPYNLDEVVKYNDLASDSVWRNFDSKTLDKNSDYVVNMYYRGSPNQRIAYDEGKGVTGTHTGYLSHDGNQWVVVHNIHGKIYSEPFVKLLGKNKKWGVTSIMKPRINNFLNLIKHYREKFGI